MNVKQLKKALAKLPDDYEVVAYEQGSVYETVVKAVEVNPHEEQEARIVHGCK